MITLPRIDKFRHTKLNRGYEVTGKKGGISFNGSRFYGGNVEKVRAVVMGTQFSERI